jgi:hypothetical protein
MAYAGAPDAIRMWVFCHRGQVFFPLMRSASFNPTERCNEMGETTVNKA